MALLLVGVLLLVSGCASNETKQRRGHPEAFAAAFDVTTGRLLWLTHIQPPISGMDTATMDKGAFVVDGVPPMRDCSGNDLEIAFDAATGAEVRRGHVRKFVEIAYPSTGPTIAQDDTTVYGVELHAGRPVLRAVEQPDGHMRWQASLPDPHHQFLVRASYVIGLISHATLYVTGSSDPMEIDFKKCAGD